MYYLSCFYGFLSSYFAFYVLLYSYFVFDAWLKFRCKLFALYILISQFPPGAKVSLQNADSSFGVRSSDVGTVKSPVPSCVLGPVRVIDKSTPLAKKVITSNPLLQFFFCAYF
jgi:hypothetical protein